MKRLLTLLVLLLAAPAYATDGDDCTAAQFQTISHGPVRAMWCVQVCDGDTANSDCTEYDMSSRGGLTDALVFAIYENGTDCTAATVTINSSDDSGLTTASQNAYDLGLVTTLTFTDPKLTYDNRVAPIGRYIYATWSGIAGCAGSHTVDLLMIGYEEVD